MIPESSVLGRDIIARRMEADLVGPREPDEELSSRPTDVYLTGILWPFAFGADAEDDERLGTAGAAEGPESRDPEADSVPAVAVQKPAVMGISFAIAGR